MEDDPTNGLIEDSTEHRLHQLRSSSTNAQLEVLRKILQDIERAGESSAKTSRSPLMWNQSLQMVVYKKS